MLGLSLIYFRRQDKTDAPISIPGFLVYGIALFYFVFYVAMGMIMTWAFFWWMLFFAVAAYYLGSHLLNYHKGSGRAVFLYMGIAAFLTVILGGYAREAGRPRFVDRIANYDDVYVPQERQRYLYQDISPEEIAKLPSKPPVAGAAQLIQKHCARCHSLDRMRGYTRNDWERVVNVMRIYGTRLTDDEAAQITKHLAEGKSY